MTDIGGKSRFFNNLGHMSGLNLVGTFQVGDGAADLENAAISAGAQSELIDRVFRNSERAKKQLNFINDVG